MSKVIDVFTYNGESDILEIHLNVLNDYVDEFIIVEAPTTFSGKEKPLYFEQQKDRFKDFLHKIKYFVIDEDYTEEEIVLAKSSPNTQGAEHWTHEFLQKESIRKALTHLDDDDIVFIGDADEVWNPICAESFRTTFAIANFPCIVKLKLRVYSYFLNNKSDEQFWGTLVTNYANIKDECLNHLRTNDLFKNKEYCGWHFTSMGGEQELRRKLSDSYTQETYNNQWIQDNLHDNIKGNRDFLGRDFRYWISEEEWPAYLKENKDKYLHLCK